LAVYDCRKKVAQEEAEEEEKNNDVPELTRNEIDMAK
jgi:calmodulin